MNSSDEKTRLVIGSLAVLAVLVIGYALYQAFGQPEAPPPPPAAPVQQAEKASPETSAPGPLAMQITTETSVAANSGGHEASVTGEPGLDYEWTLKGGTIQGDPHGSSITWNAGEGTEAILSCKGTARGKEGTTSIRITLKQAPQIARFEAASPVITEGTAAKLSWAASNTQKLVLNPGGQDVTKYSGPALEVKPEQTTTYTLTASNSSGIEITKELLIKVVPKPDIVSFKSDPVAGALFTFTVTAEFKGSKAELKNGATVVATSEASPLQVQVPDLKEGSTLLLTVTNEAGTYVSSTLTFSVKTK